MRGESLSGPPPRRIGIRDVAQRAGVAISTVSKVFSGKGEVMPALRMRVLTAAAELGYQPNYVAQSLRRGATDLIGFVASDLSDPFSAEIVAGAEFVLRPAGYALLVMSSNHDPEIDAANVRTLNSRRVDAVLVSPSREDDSALLAALAEFDGPIVAIESELRGPLAVDAVCADHRAGMRDAVEHLVRLGHTRIAALTGPVARRSGRERRAGLLDALRAHGYEDRALPIVTEHDAAAAEAEVLRVLDGDTPPTALLAGGLVAAHRRAPRRRQASPCRRPRSRARRLGRRAARRVLAAADRGGRPRSARPRRRGRDACAEAARPWRRPLRGTGPGRRPAGAVHSPPLLRQSARSGHILGRHRTWLTFSSLRRSAARWSPAARAASASERRGRLLDIGAKVAIADLPAALDRMDAAERSRFLPIAMDVTDDASVASGVADAAKALGGLDTLVNSAGVFQFRAIEGIATAEWDRILDVNLKGTFLVMREAMPHLKASKRGRVVNIASDAGKKGFALLGAYCASKFGVVGLTQAIGAEVAPDGVRVNAVCPGTVAETGMGQVVIEQKIELGYGGSPEEIVRRGADSFPLKRVGTVADVVSATLFLISESSNWIAGESINVDGGSLAG